MYIHKHAYLISVLCLAPGIGLTGVARELKKKKQTQKTRIGWSGISDGKATAPPKFSIFILYSWARREDYYTHINKEAGLLHVAEQGFS